MDIQRSVKSSDTGILQRQLNNDNINIAGILGRCPYDHPVLVLLNPSLPDDKKKESHLNFMAISTLLWLTCPYLNERIHDLESSGYVDKIGKFIRSDRTISSRMINAHASFYYLRKRVFHKYVGGISSLEENQNVLCTGIGGIREMENIRCLHMHYAHYLLYPDNPVGRIIESLLEGKTCCEKGQCGIDSP